MRYKYAFLLLFFLQLSVTAQNDCADALVVCGNSGYQGLTATGFGVQELDNTNNCGSFENNSIWLQLPVKTGGTLGFTIIPGSSAIVVDFDFFIYGPNATCGNLGQAIRCSTTNPEAAGSLSNHTGMNGTETDVSEGPGFDGNNFVQWLTVQDGETYFLVIDRPIGSSDFSIEWSGTAEFYDEVSFNNPSGNPLHISKCDDDAIDDGSTAFDLTANEAMLMGSQSNVALTYHLTLNDAVIQENSIAQPAAFANTAPVQDIFMRMTNTLTGCFETEVLQIELINPVTAGEPEDLFLCDFDENGIQRFNLAQNDDNVRNGMPNTSVTYYASLAGAENKANPLNSLHENAAPYTAQTIWARVETVSGCFGHDITSFTINVTPLPEIIYTVNINDFRKTDNSISIEMANPQDFEFSIDGENFTETPVFENLSGGEYTIYIRAVNGCRMVSEKVAVLNYPTHFSPNGDSFNDTWRIPYLSLRPDAVVTIFDRYGKVVGGFKGGAGWDGRFNGSNLPSTDYWFVIQMDNHKIIKGHFAMIR